MAMDDAVLAAAIKASLVTNGFNVTITGKDATPWLSTFVDVISEEIVAHVLANAQCDGNDSSGDSHGNVGII